MSHSSLNIFFTYLVEVFSFVLILIILSGRREARANFAWVLAVLFFPLIGALAYLIFGRPHIRNMIEKKMKRYRFLDIKQTHNQCVEYETEKLGETITKVTGMSPMLCRDLQLISDGSVKYDLLERDILNAKRYVLMEYYLYRYDETGQRIANALVTKAKEGVPVYFMVDGFGSLGLIFTKIHKKLKEAGINVAVFHSPFRLKTASRVNFRNHRKIVVVDGEIAYTGGMNIGNEYAEKSKWSDAHLRFEGDAVIAVASYFAEDWMFAGGDDISELINKSFSQPGGDRTVHVIPSGPHQTTPMIYDSLYTAITRAERSIDIITPYLVPNQPMIENLKNVARQGVRVRVIVPGKNNHPVAAAAGRSYYEELIDAGVEIYETKGTMLHAKIVLIDGFWTTVGSANMDARSFKLNFELNIIVYSHSFAADAYALLQNYLSESRRIPLEEAKGRNFAVRVLEGVCRTLSPVL